MRTQEERAVSLALDDERGRLKSLLDGFLPGERRALEDACRLILLSLPSLPGDSGTRDSATAFPPAKEARTRNYSRDSG